MEKDNIMSCGHLQRYIVSSDEGTSYCMECAWEADIADFKKTLRTFQNALDREEIKVAKRDNDIENLRSYLGEAIRHLNKDLEWFASYPFGNKEFETNSATGRYHELDTFLECMKETK
jgi:hypothetical protein